MPSVLAGSKQAAIATNKTKSMTNEKVGGSHGFTSNNNCSSNLVAQSAPATPAARPMNVSFNP
jgi:hypothetical protein